MQNIVIAGVGTTEQADRLLRIHGQQSGCKNISLE